MRLVKRFRINGRLLRNNARRAAGDADCCIVSHQHGFRKVADSLIAVCIPFDILLLDIQVGDTHHIINEILAVFIVKGEGKGTGVVLANLNLVRGRVKGHMTVVALGIRICVDNCLAVDGFAKGITVQVRNLPVGHGQPSAVGKLIYLDSLVRTLGHKIPFQSAAADRGFAGNGVVQERQSKGRGIHSHAGRAGDIIDNHRRLEAQVQQAARYDAVEVDLATNSCFLRHGGLSHSQFPRDPGHDRLKVYVAGSADRNARIHLTVPVQQHLEVRVQSLVSNDCAVGSCFRISVFGLPDVPRARDIQRVGPDGTDRLGIN